MSCESFFINDLTEKLHGKFSDEDLQLILQNVEDVVYQYDINEKETHLSVIEPDGLPKIAKTFLVVKKIEGRSLGTLNLYKIYLKDFFEYLNKDIKDITANDIRIYLYNLQERRKISNRTLDRRRAIISSFFSWLFNEDYIQRNPCLQVAPIKYEEKPRQPLTDIEMEIIRNNYKDTREKAIVEMLYSTACRVSELANLKISDINFETKEVHLLGKGQKHRISYLNARAEVALKNYLSERKGNSDYIFLSIKKPYDNLRKEGIERIVRKLGERTNIKLYPHRIRHTTATNALSHGMSVADLQSILGHSKLDTTMIYAKVQQSDILYNHHKCIV